MQLRRRSLTYCVGFFLYTFVQFFLSSLSPFGYDVEISTTPIVSPAISEL